MDLVPFRSREMLRKVVYELMRTDSSPSSIRFRSTSTTSSSKMASQPLVDPMYKQYT